MIRIIKSLLATSAFFVWSADAGSPNIVFLLVDDLGWADVRCNADSFYETPNIEALAASGVRFTQAYAACPVCSPTRASILTGRHPVRVNITDWIPGYRATESRDAPRFDHVDDRESLDLAEVTIPEYLRESANYQTFFLGKWHLGGEGFWPTDQGFDVNIGGCERGSPPGGYYAPWNNPNLVAKEDGEYLTDRLTDEAIALIESAESERPFLLYLSYYSVHTPIEPDRKSINHFRETRFEGPTPVIADRHAVSRARRDNAAYASMVHAVDRSVGRVLATIERMGIGENTIVVFYSDNGGLCTLPERRGQRGGPTSNLPLRSGKGWLYEGGIRVPLIMRVPNMTRPGTSCNDPVFSTDFFPTFVEILRLPAKPDLYPDGISLVPHLNGKAAGSRTLHWHYPHYHGSGWKPGAAIRDGDWKLIEFYEYDQTELYNLAEDPGERNDLARTRPEIRDRLKRSLIDWQQGISAKMPIAVAKLSQ